MSKEQKDKILKAMADCRNNYIIDCQEQIAEAQGKIAGIDYMYYRFLDVLKTCIEPQTESEEEE